MKPFVIDRNSWHYKMISRGERWDFLTYREPKDFCSYWRKVVLKLCWFAFVATFLSVFALFLGYNIYMDPLPVLGGISAGLGLLFGSVGIAFWLEKRKEQRRQHDYDVEFNEKQESLLKMKYRAWKEKVCPMVEYK